MMTPHGPVCSGALFDLQRQSKINDGVNIGLTKPSGAASQTLVY
jgi:hypothetical protein